MPSSNKITRRYKIVRIRHYTTMEWAEIPIGIVIEPKQPSQNSSPTNLFISNFLTEKKTI